ncbi:MAG: hypothetical protein RJB26_2389, partial [Pseudomonadota bacterium]
EDDDSAKDTKAAPAADDSKKA